MADDPKADDKIRKEIEAKLKAASTHVDTAKLDAAIKEAKTMKGDKDMD